AVGAVGQRDDAGGHGRGRAAARTAGGAPQVPGGAGGGAGGRLGVAGQTELGGRGLADRKGAGIEDLLGDAVGERGDVPGERCAAGFEGGAGDLDRKSTRLNSSHVSSSYAVFCLKN